MQLDEDTVGTMVRTALRCLQQRFPWTAEPSRKGPGSGGEQVAPVADDGNPTYFTVFRKGSSIVAMIAIEKTKTERGKLLAAIVAFAMIVCAIAAVIPAVEADGANAYEGDGFSIQVPGYDNIGFVADTDGTIIASGYAGIASSTENIIGTETTFVADFGTPGEGYGYALLKLTAPAGTETVTIKQTNSALAGYVGQDNRVQNIDGKYVKTNEVSVEALADSSSFLIPTDGSKVVFEITYDEKEPVTITINFASVVTAPVIDAAEDIDGIDEGVLTLDEDTVWIVNGDVSVSTIKTIDLSGYDLTIAESAAGGSLSINGAADANLIKAQDASTQATLKVDGATLNLTSFEDARQMLVNTQGNVEGLIIEGINGAEINMNKTGTSSMIGTGNGNTIIKLDNAKMTLTGNGGVQAVLVQAVNSTVDATGIGNASFAGYFDLKGSKVIASNVNAYATDLVDSTIEATANLGIFTAKTLLTAAPFEDFDVAIGTLDIDKTSSLKADKIYDCLYNSTSTGATEIATTANITGGGTVSGDFVSNTTQTNPDNPVSNFTMSGITLKDSNISEGVEVEVGTEISVAGDITGEGTISGGKIALQDKATIGVTMTGTTVTAPGSDPTDPDFDFDDAPTITINGVTYSVITVSFDNLYSCSFGISIKDATYTGEPVRWAQINPQASNLNNTGVKATLYKDDYQFVEKNEDGTYTSVDAPITVGTHYIRLTVNVDYSPQGTGNQLNLNVEVVVPFEIKGLSAEADVSVDAWDVKGPCNVPEVTYTYTDEDGTEHTITDLGEIPCEYSIYLTDEDGNKYYYPGDWTTEKLMFDGETKKFTLHADFGAWDVYNACSAGTTEVELFNYTDAASKLTFGAPDEDELYYGISAGRLQSNVSINTAPNFDPKTYAYTTKITGTVYKLSSYPSFWVEPSADRAGYYIAFTVSASNGVDWKDTVLTITNEAGETAVFNADNVFDGYFVLYLGETLKDTYTYTIVYDQDSGDFYKETTYTVTIDVDASTWFYGIYLHDDGNASFDQQTHEVLYATAMEGAIIELPNKADVNAEFLGWKSYVTGYVFDAGSPFVVSEKYADASGKIVLTAICGEPVEDVILHTVTFVNGHDQYKVTVVEGQAVAMPFDPTSEGQEFVGWFLEGSDVPYDFNSNVYEDLTLIAIFKDVTPVDPEYASNFVMGLKKDDSGVFVSLVGIDGVIPAGRSIVITYQYMVWDDFFEMYIPSEVVTLSAIPVVGGLQYNITSQEPSDFTSFDTVVTITASFVDSDGKAICSITDDYEVVLA